jgi:hypothetical protein
MQDASSNHPKILTQLDIKNLVKMLTSYDKENVEMASLIVSKITNYEDNIAALYILYSLPQFDCIETRYLFYSYLGRVFGQLDRSSDYLFSVNKHQIMLILNFFKAEPRQYELLFKYFMSDVVNLLPDHLTFTLNITSNDK